MNQDRPATVEQPAPSRSLPDTGPYPPAHTTTGKPRRSGRGWIWLLIVVLLAAGIYFVWPKKKAGPADATAGPPGAAGRRGAGAIPVVVAKARKGNIPVYFTGLGAVTPIYTVEVKSRVDGELMELHYKEGDIVEKGAPLIEIDPRPYQVQLTQAEGQLIRDQALLENARIDLARYKTLLTQNAVPEQQVATQQALVDQDVGIVKSDQGAIDSAKLNITYSHITSPITGRVGLRLVDPGNIVHAADTNPLLVITQIEPISVIFTITEDQLPVVQQKLHAGQHLRVDAFDRSSNTQLASGVLTTLDNQIDQTTGTLKLRATFDNKNNVLFPNQFVNVRLLVQLKQSVTLIPTATVQRNSQTTYVFLVEANNKVTVRSINIGTTEGDDSEVTSGLAAGDTVVMTGVDKLQEGTQVSAHLTTDTGQRQGQPARSQLPGVPPTPAAQHPSASPAHKAR